MAGMNFPTWKQIGIPEIIPETIRKTNNNSRIKSLLDYLILRTSSYKLSARYCCTVCNYSYNAKKISDDYPECINCSSKYIRANYFLNYSQSGGLGSILDNNIVENPPANIINIINGAPDPNLNVPAAAVNNFLNFQIPPLQVHGNQAQLNNQQPAEEEYYGDEEEGDSPKKHKGDKTHLLCKVIFEFYRKKYPEYQIQPLDIVKVKWNGDSFTAEFLGGEESCSSSIENAIIKAALLIPSLWDIEQELVLRKFQGMNTPAFDITPVIGLLFGLQLSY